MPFKTSDWSFCRGQTIYVEADACGDQLTNLREVDHIEERGKTIIANFEQMDDGEMELSVNKTGDPTS